MKSLLAVALLSLLSPPAFAGTLAERVAATLHNFEGHWRFKDADNFLDFGVLEQTTSSWLIGWESCKRDEEGFKVCGQNKNVYQVSGDALEICEAKFEAENWACVDPRPAKLIELTPTSIQFEVALGNRRQRQTIRLLEKEKIERSMSLLDQEGKLLQESSMVLTHLENDGHEH